MSGFLPWSIAHLSIEEPLPLLEENAGSAGFLLFFWCSDQPVGQLSIPRSLLPLTSLQLAAMVPTAIASAMGNRLIAGAFPRDVFPPDAAPPVPSALPSLLQLARPIEAFFDESARRAHEPGDGVSSFSVIVCTRNNPERLKTLLASIRDLSLPPDEVVVVDSDPSSGRTAPIVDLFPKVRYVPCATRGLSGARNAGIRNSTGDLIAFTDDDVTVHRGWTAAMRRVFRDPRVSASTGLVLPAELRTLAQDLCRGDHWDFRAADFGPDFFRSWIDRGVPSWRIGSGVNMAFRRDVFDRYGHFDERLGAGAAGSSEDSEFWYRLLAAGRSCRYEPAAVVFARRTDETPLSTQSFNYMRGHVAALLFQFDRHRHRGNIARVFRRLPARFLVLAFGVMKRAVLTQAFEGDPSFMPLLPQIRGAIAGCGYYLRYRWHRAGADDRQGD